MSQEHKDSLTPRERLSLVAAALRGRRTEKTARIFEKPLCGTVTIINDCRDGNARGRQQARFSALTGLSTNFIGVSNDLQAAGNLVDAFDAVENIPSERETNPRHVIAVNVAPRNGTAKRWKNGTPFGYFRTGNTMVVSTIAGQTLSLVRKLGLATHINVIDSSAALKELGDRGRVALGDVRRIEDTQFRSYEFSPAVAAHLLQGGSIPSHPVFLSEIVTPPAGLIWEVDVFGNCKTVIPGGEVSGNILDDGESGFGILPHYPRLKDVPDGVLATVVGSSGFRDKRFLEIIKQGGHAFRTLQERTGALLSGDRGNS